MSTLSLWSRYHRTGSTEMRPHRPGEDMTEVSVSDADRPALAHPGGMLARSDHNPNDIWYINQRHFEAHYDPDPDQE